MLTQIKQAAVTAAKEAGRMLEREYEKFNRAAVMLKSKHEVLTKADLMSQEIIIKEIRKHFPGHGIVSEEQKNQDRQPEYCWYLDPLDGTTNFSIHNPLWSISLALAKENELVFGLVYAPLLGEIFTAQAGQGAELNGRTIMVSKTNQGKVINTFCHGSRDADIKKAAAYWRKQKLAEVDCRQLGSAAIELAYVASGRVESFLAPGVKVWDVAAGVLLVRQAGGTVTDFQGREWRLGDTDIAASNGKVHGQILRAIGGK
ncbi:MAG: inositol monophosphatase family protein [Patescibacteria group bacterium]|nr:inositol monophosphatase family protein [Patescibacteria group bacterium]